VVERDHPFRAQHVRAADGELSDRSATPHRDNIAALDVAILRGHESGREDVREEQCLVVAQAFGNFHGTDIGERHAHILRLPAGKPAEEVRVTEQPGGALPVNLLRHLRVRVAVVA
jgi:hypothetical protein